MSVMMLLYAYGPTVNAKTVALGTPSSEVLEPAATPSTPTLAAVRHDLVSKICFSS